MRRCLIAQFIFCIFLSFSADAATITVATLEDNADPNVQIRGCTLRDAIVAANTDQPAGECLAGNGPDKIVFAGTLNGAIHLIGALPQVVGELDILGPRGNTGRTIAIDGGGITRLLDVAVTPFLMSDITLGNGAAVAGPGAPSSDKEGGAVNIEGGGRGAAEFIRVRFRGNIAENAGGALFVWTAADVIISECEFRENQVVGVDAAGGGAIFLNVSNDGSSAQTITVTRSTFERNMVRRPDNKKLLGQPSGGAIALLAVSAADFSLQIDTSTFWKNEAGHDGGGIFTTRRNSSGNPQPQIVIRNSTIAFNVADSEGDGFGDGGGILSTSVHPVELINAVVAKNTASSNSQSPDIRGTIVSGGHNFFGSITQTSSTTPTDIVGTLSRPQDPWLNGEELADNGGFTKTVEPRRSARKESPLIEKGLCEGFDQRGLKRPRVLGDISFGPSGNGCDIGAVEYDGISR